MQSHITIIIPTHNRHNYLRRAIKYYTEFKYPVVVLDSSTTAFEFDIPISIEYIHLPVMSLPDKLHFGFTHIQTEFVVMCADDDFLILDGVDECLTFLLKHRKYSVADGSVFFYKKDDVFKTGINFNLLYKTGLDISFESENALIRLGDFFKNYRTVFYGVHYTKNLKVAYEKCSHAFNNLFLNEYLSALIPVSAGYCKIIPKLIMVREFTDESGDKTTPTLERMFADTNGVQELDQYTDCVSRVIFSYTETSLQECRTALKTLLKDYAAKIGVDKQVEHDKSQSIIKRLGKIILKIPVIGIAIVQQRRLNESKKEIAQIINTDADSDNLKLIEKQIHDFRLIC